MLLQVSDGMGAAAAVGTASDLPGIGQRVVSDLSQDVDGLSRTWADAGGPCPGPWWHPSALRPSSEVFERLLAWTPAHPLVIREAAKQRNLGPNEVIEPRVQHDDP